MDMLFNATSCIRNAQHSQVSVRYFNKAKNGPHSCKLEWMAKTDTGLVRTHNEDAIALNSGCNFAVLADGMGGYNAGEVASAMAVNLIEAHLVSNLHVSHKDTQKKKNAVAERCLEEATLLANTAIMNAAASVPQYEGMGTTLVAAIYHDGTLTIAHVGDSRAYRYRDGALTQLTRDHSLLQEQIDAGLLPPQAMQFARHKNIITRALGVDRHLVAEIHHHPCEPGDLYMLCSDGLTDMLSDHQIEEIMSSHSDDDQHEALQELAVMASTLINSANAHGGKDNISIVLARMIAAPDA